MKPRPSTPAIWYNANGHEWGQLGPNGEHLDPNGDPPTATERPSRLWPVPMMLLVLMLLTVVALWAAWVGKLDGPSPASIPSPAPGPCQVKR